MRRAITSHKIPTLESGAARLLLELSDADISIDNVIELVQMSPSIAAKLVSCANSAWSNPVLPVTTIGDACSRLGLNVVRTTTIALAIGQSFDANRCPSFDAERFWCTSIIASELAAAIASRFAVERNTARTGALLYNIGLLWLADALPEETRASLDCAKDNPECSISGCLKHHCGMSRREASLHLYTAWRLPAALVDGLANKSAAGLSRLAPVCEAMATDVFSELPADRAVAAERGEFLREAYAAALAKLPETKELAATLF